MISISLLFATALLLAPSHASTLFPFEKIQLTREYIDTLPAEDAALFAFGNQTIESKAAVVRCRYAPDDGKWPSEKAWTKLSKQLSTPTALIKTVPQSAVCYPGTNVTDDAKCQQLTKGYQDWSTHVDDPTEVFAPIYQGLTCTPPAIYDSGGCTLGGYPSYVVKASTVLDIQLGINFARNDGVRLVVKNTGHDYTGKSAGLGALSIWTHGLKDIQYIESYVDGSGYKGPAFKAGAGVQVSELYKAASDRGVMVVGSDAQTVGIMGGYIQGGGYSPLSSSYGLAADQVLGFEIVTPIGEFVTANSTSNPDLFWALRGGGGGTFGVVTSVTVKAFKETTVTAASWSIDSTKVSVDRFWDAVRAFVDRFTVNADNGTYVKIQLTPNANGKDAIFTVQPLFAPGKTSKDVNALLSPYQSRLQSLNVPFSPKITEYKSFYAAWQSEFSTTSTNADIASVFGSRLFPRSNFESEIGRSTTFSVLREAVTTGHTATVINVAPTLARSGNPDNAVSPAWRGALLHAVVRRTWASKLSTADVLAARKSFEAGIMQKWRDVAPGSGAYLNEADRTEPNWQQSFWGDKYARLLAIKKDIDVKDVFWANNAVGSEGWFVENSSGLPDENGKLCRVGVTESSTTTRATVATPAVRAVRGLLRRADAVPTGAV
ncbi:FAD binding domain-containing protein [Aaosphaeria arxii CBS 175.79]|uniref:FAD binding domain-containing protein n=1 Tax=Aaosphaeria arxii CBS 175.79 TaxID=1450172 RepID=A0A6A5Y5N0_9PLEO|nr:FAD binding domain-containing protein [Aaosphaeria arxii CBS 175.79]KAF2020151.1 FAD binding domain-containing protein [Aaosphaeria arxii CBS 175.79]